VGALIRHYQFDGALEARMNRYILISGASSGIGKAASHALVRQGITVFAGALNDAEAEAIRAQGLSKLIPVVLDVTDKACVDAALRTVSETIGDGHLYGLLNCAGVDINAPLHILEEEEILRMIDVNYVGAIRLTRSALPLLKSNHGASRIAFVSSAMANLYTPTISIYCSTKSGLSGFADALRVELIPAAIRVSVIEPGVVRTPLVQASPEILERMLARMSDQDRSRYETMMRKITRLSSSPNAGVTTDKTSKAIVHALLAAKPKIRYRVGIDSKAAAVIRSLPFGVIDWCVRRIYGF